MYGEGGYAYVYLCYGIHCLLNLVTGQEGEGAAVLIRACEPVRGLSHVLARRKAKRAEPSLLTGPGKVMLQTRSQGAFLGWLIPQLPTQSSS